MIILAIIITYLIVAMILWVISKSINDGECFEDEHGKPIETVGNCNCEPLSFVDCLLWLPMLIAMIVNSIFKI